MNSTRIPYWLARLLLPRALVLMPAGAFVGLIMDICVEHVDVVPEHAVAWLPIVFGAFMTGACVFWNAPTRRITTALFLLAFVVGGMGIFLHNHGKLATVAINSMNAWIRSRIEKHVLTVGS